MRWLPILSEVANGARMGFPLDENGMEEKVDSAAASTPGREAAQDDGKKSLVVPENEAGNSVDGSRKAEDPETPEEDALL